MIISADVATIEIGSGKDIQITRNGKVVAYVFYEGENEYSNGSTAPRFCGRGIVQNRALFDGNAIPSFSAGSVINEIEIEDMPR